MLDAAVKAARRFRALERVVIMFGVTRYGANTRSARLPENGEGRSGDRELN